MAIIASLGNEIKTCSHLAPTRLWPRWLLFFRFVTVNVQRKDSERCGAAQLRTEKRSRCLMTIEFFDALPVGGVWQWVWQGRGRAAGLVRASHREPLRAARSHGRATDSHGEPGRATESYRGRRRATESHVEPVGEAWPGVGGKGVVERGGAGEWGRRRVRQERGTSAGRGKSVIERGMGCIIHRIFAGPPWLQVLKSSGIFEKTVSF